VKAESETHSSAPVGHGSPAPEAIVRLRLAVQEFAGVRITEGQALCADMVHTSTRAWQQWEHGDRRMHPAFWELAQIRVAMLRGELVRAAAPVKSSSHSARTDAGVIRNRG